MSTDRCMDKEAVVHIYNAILLSHTKECIWLSSNEVDERRAYYTEWSKSEREKQIEYSAQSLSRVWLFATPWTAARQVFLSTTSSRSLLKLSSSSQWCHPIISSSVIPFSSLIQSFSASGSFQMSQFFASGGWSIGASASASALPMNIQDCFPLGFTGWIPL